jgi:excisionase family DNA binding protein
MNVEMQVEYLSIAEVADFLKKDRTQVWRYIRHKLLPAMKLGNQWVVERTAIENFTPPRRGNPNFRKS